MSLCPMCRAPSSTSRYCACGYDFIDKVTRRDPGAAPVSQNSLPDDERAKVLGEWTAACERLKRIAERWEAQSLAALPEAQERNALADWADAEVKSMIYSGRDKGYPPAVKLARMAELLRSRGGQQEPTLAEATAELRAPRGCHDWSPGLARGTARDICEKCGYELEDHPASAFAVVIQQARDEVYRLCQYGENVRWRMTIPVDDKRDSDIIIGRGLNIAALLSLRPQQDGELPTGPVAEPYGGWWLTNDVGDTIPSVRGCYYIVKRFSTYEQAEAARLVIAGKAFVASTPSPAASPSIPEPSEEAKELAALKALLNTPEIEDFDKAVPLEAAHQVVRWGVAHDAGKEATDWYWVVGHLAGKALYAYMHGDVAKAKHHVITTAAVLRNWHAALRAGESLMRPGVDVAVDFGSTPKEE